MNYAQNLIRMNRTKATMMKKQADQILQQMDDLEAQIADNPEIEDKINGDFIKMEIDIMTGDAPEDAQGSLDILAHFNGQDDEDESWDS